MINDVERGYHLYQIMLDMTRRGSSVVLNWGEDTEQWEAAWITGGRRYVAIRCDPLDALADAYAQERR